MDDRSSREQPPITVWERERKRGGHRLNRKRSQRIIENRATTDRSPSFLPQKFPPTRSRYDSHGTKRSSIRDRPRNRPIAAREETRWKGLRSEPPPTVYTLYTVETSVGSFSFESAAVAFDDRINWQIGTACNVRLATIYKTYGRLLAS